MDLIEIPIGSTVYVGKGHSLMIPCSSSIEVEYENAMAVFQLRNEQRINLKVKVCPICKCIFLPFRKYEKHWCSFQEYIFIRTKTGKKPYQEDIKSGKFKPNENYSPPPIDYHEIYKTPDYIKKGLKYPFQGGRMSPR